MSEKRERRLTNDSAFTPFQQQRILFFQVIEETFGEFNERSKIRLWRLKLELSFEREGFFIHDLWVVRKGGGGGRGEGGVFFSSPFNIVICLFKKKTKFCGHDFSFAWGG